MTETMMKMYVELPIKVKSYDTDYMKIVNNTVHVKWFEDLRTAILDEYFPLEEMLKENNTPILAETNVKYKRPVTLESKPIGKAWVSELGKSRWVIEIEIGEGETIYCTGRQEGYFFNMTTMRPTRFPQEFLDKYSSI